MKKLDGVHWDADALHHVLYSVIDELKVKQKFYMMALRHALTGMKVRVSVKLLSPHSIDTNADRPAHRDGHARPGQGAYTSQAGDGTRLCRIPLTRCVCSCGCYAMRDECVRYSCR